MKRLFTLLSLLLLGVGASGVAAQERTVTGRVTNAETQQPLAGVQVVVTGTGIGTLTDASGTYSLRVPEGATTLTFSSIGFASRALPISGATVNAALSPTAVEVEGVVVTAMGIEREKRALGTAVQEIAGEELAEAPEMNIVNSLAGRVAGVQITNAGPAGGSSRIVIRGASSIAGNNQPLFVVDGVPISNMAMTNGGGEVNFGYGGIDYGNAAQDINPNDIASITVLKGPNAAALYGSRAANGAVIITTKSGRGAGDFNITVNSSTTFEEPLRLPEYQNRYGQGLFGVFEFVDGAGGGTFDFVDESWGPPLDQGLCIRQFHTPEGQDCSPWVSNPNNVANFFETGWTTNNNVALTASGERANMRLSVSRLDQNGMYPGQELERTTVALSGGASPTERLSASASVNYISSEGQNRPGTGYGTDNPMQQFVWFGRQVNTELLRDYKLEDTPTCAGGTPFNWNYNYHANPYWIAQENCNFDARNRVIGSAEVRYQFLPWLSGSIQSGTDWFRDSRQRNYAAGFIDYPDGAFGQDDIFFREINTQAALSANRALTSELSLNATVGAATRDNRFELTTTSVGELIVPGTYNVSNAAITPEIDYELQRRRINSLFGTAQVGFRDLLFVEMTGRNDWSSTLPEANNSYFYPSVSTSFIFSDAFGLSDRMYGKVRASWARVGNDADPYQLASVYASGTPFGGVPRFEVPNQLPNADLKPEITESWEVGTELSFLNNRVGLDLTYYDAVTRNQILAATISAASGFTSQVLNAGAIRNRGVEALLSVVPLQLGDFRWEVTGNFAKNNSEVEELYPGLTSITLGGLTYWGVSAEARVGEPYGQLYGVDFLRDDAGNIVVDESGLPLPDNSKRVALGNYNPDWIGGLRNSFSYRNLGLSVLFDVRQGGELFSVTNMFGNYAGVLSTSLRGRENGVTPIYDAEGNLVGQECDPGIVVEGVKQDGTPNDITICPQDYFGQLYYVDSPHIYDASFVKLREMKLDWTVPQSLIDRTPFSMMQVGIVGRNLLLWSDIPHIDPETAFDASNRQGFEFGQLPSARSVGINFTIRP